MNNNFSFLRFKFFYWIALFIFSIITIYDNPKLIYDICTLEFLQIVLGLFLIPSTPFIIGSFLFWLIKPEFNSINQK
jgi:hypothetical protein